MKTRVVPTYVPSAWPGFVMSVAPIGMVKEVALICGVIVTLVPPAADMKLKLFTVTFVLPLVSLTAVSSMLMDTGNAAPLMTRRPTFGTPPARLREFWSSRTRRFKPGSMRARPARSGAMASVPKSRDVATVTSIAWMRRTIIGIVPVAAAAVTIGFKAIALNSVSETNPPEASCFKRGGAFFCFFVGIFYAFPNITKCSKKFNLITLLYQYLSIIFL